MRGGRRPPEQGGERESGRPLGSQRTTTNRERRRRTAGRARDRGPPPSWCRRGGLAKSSRPRRLAHRRGGSDRNRSACHLQRPRPSDSQGTRGERTKAPGESLRGTPRPSKEWLTDISTSSGERATPSTYL